MKKVTEMRSLQIAVDKAHDNLKSAEQAVAVAREAFHWAGYKLAIAKNLKSADRTELSYKKFLNRSGLQANVVIAIDS